MYNIEQKSNLAKFKFEQLLLQDNLWSIVANQTQLSFVDLVPVSPSSNNVWLVTSIAVYLIEVSTIGTSTKIIGPHKMTKVSKAQSANGLLFLMDTDFGVKIFRPTSSSLDLVTSIDTSFVEASASAKFVDFEAR